jgi:hypothetical protein
MGPANVEIVNCHSCREVSGTEARKVNYFKAAAILANHREVLKHGGGMLAFIKTSTQKIGIDIRW